MASIPRINNPTDVGSPAAMVPGAYNNNFACKHPPGDDLLYTTARVQGAQDSLATLLFAASTRQSAFSLSMRWKWKKVDQDSKTKGINKVFFRVGTVYLGETSAYL